ncbi:MAG TPA: patatin-like phospholipase family protein [Pseudonocardiaceae bacterium]
MHAVLEVLGERAATGSRPGARSDGHRVALVVEGGGMRGVVSCAMAAAIEELGLVDAFDLVVGTSAGALNGAAVLAGVAGGCTEEYSGGFASRAFFSPARLLLGRPAVNVGYTLDFSSPRLDADRHARTHGSAIELHCVATDVDAAAARDLTRPADVGELRTMLLASSRLPWIGGEPVRFRGRRWLDGGLCEPIPLDAALAAGATHALVLLTQPLGYRMHGDGDGDQLPGRGERYVARRLRLLNPALAEAFDRRGAAYTRATARVTDGDEHVLGIALPRGTRVPGRLDRDVTRLRAAADLSRATALGVLTAAARRTGDLSGDPGPR